MYISMYYNLCIYLCTAYGFQSYSEPFHVWVWYEYWCLSMTRMIRMARTMPIARAVWKRMLRILYPIYGKQVYTWGFVRWGRLAEELQNYEKAYVDFLLLSDGRHVLEVSYTTTFCCLKETRSSLRYLL